MKGGERDWSWERLAPAAVLAGYVALWLALPARAVHGDALDELLNVESPWPYPISKHPAAEPSLWLIVRGLRALGYGHSALRSGQRWSAVWMTLALVGLYRFGRRAGVERGTALALTALAGGSYAAVHLSLDSFLFYWPPGLALMTWALVIARDADRKGAWLGAALLLVAAAQYHPMCLIGAPLAAALVLRRHPSSRGLYAAALVAGLAPAVTFAVRRFYLHTELEPKPPFGYWYQHNLRDALDGMMRFVTTPRVPPFAAFHGARGAEALTVAGAWLGLGALVVPAAVGLGLALWRRPLWLLPWLAAAAAVWGFLVWWSPGQEFFYLLPAWLLLLGALDLTLAVAAPLARGPRAFSLALVSAGAGAIALASVVAYALPASDDESEELAAMRVADRFSNGDRLLLPDFADPRIDYYGHRATIGMIELFCQRANGRSTLDVLADKLAETRAQHASLWVETAPDGRPRVPPWVVEQIPIDYGEADFARLAFGASRWVDGRQLRELVAVGAAVPWRWSALRWLWAPIVPSVQAGGAR